MATVFSKPKPKGPDPELVAAQKQQAKDLAAREAEEKRSKEARERATRARQSGGTRRGVTLFEGTGEQGVKPNLGA